MAQFKIMTNAGAVRTFPQSWIQPRQQTQPNSPPTTVTVEAYLTGTGSGSATVQIVGANVDPEINGPNYWVPLGAISLTGTSTDLVPAVGSLSVSQPWAYLGAYLSAVSGAATTVNAMANA